MESHWIGIAAWSIGVLLFGSGAIMALLNGRARALKTTFSREDRPFAYWLILLAQTVLALLFLLIVVRIWSGI